MGTRLYVGNLSPDTTPEDLHSAFASVGHPIESVQLVEDPATGRPRGFGFVELASDRDPARAIEDLSRTRVVGRRMNVDTVPRPHRSRFVGERIV